MKLGWIEPNVLAASGIPLDPEDIIAAHEQGVRAILTLTEKPLTDFRALPAALFEELDLTVTHVPVRDQYPPTMAQTAQILDFLTAMRDQKRPVLVHCHAGIGRTGTVLHLIHLARGASLTEAQNRVRAVRPQSTLLSDEQEAFLEDYADYAAALRARIE